MVKEHAGDELHIDIMELCRDTVVSLGIVSSELRKPMEMKSATPKPPPVSDTFTVDGHYPVRLGTSCDGRELYVAGDCPFVNWEYGFVGEGATSMEYADFESDLPRVTWISSAYYRVVALRHNPSDMLLPYPRIPEGAMDQTGPLFWLKFWPRRDPDLVVADQLEQLESFFNCCLVSDGLVDEFAIVDKFQEQYVDMFR